MAAWYVLTTPDDTMRRANCLHPAFSRRSVMLADDADGAPKRPGKVMGSDTSRTERLDGKSATRLV
uniref:Uncharacterized protein n=1 Tax=Zea mays TaxID=4577 RepID=C4J3Y3_MAIZE|nr:unknown [Zea mays]